MRRSGSVFAPRARRAAGVAWTSATRLKLPAQLIARLEGDDYAGLTEGVFLRGYLGSYARLVGVPVEQANQRRHGAHARRAAGCHGHDLALALSVRSLFGQRDVSGPDRDHRGAGGVAGDAWWPRTEPRAHDAARSAGSDRRGRAGSRHAERDGRRAAARRRSSRRRRHRPPIPVRRRRMRPAQVDQSPIIASMAPFASAPSAAPQAPSTGTPTADRSCGGCRRAYVDPETQRTKLGRSHRRRWPQARIRHAGSRQRAQLIAVTARFRSGSAMPKAPKCAPTERRST